MTKNDQAEVSPGQRVRLTLQLGCALTLGLGSTRRALCSRLMLSKLAAARCQQPGQFLLTLTA